MWSQPIAFAHMHVRLRLVNSFHSLPSRQTLIALALLLALLFTRRFADILNSEHYRRGRDIPGGPSTAGTL